MQDSTQSSNTPDLNFGKRVKSAVIWRSGTQIFSQTISWIATLAVIHILSPSDYGLFAMSTVVIAFLTFLNGYGFVSALIQGESLDENRVRQAFGLLIILNGSLALFQFLVAAPLAAAYYNEPQVAELLRWQSLIYLATPFIALPEALLIRELEFRKQAIINMVTGSLGGAMCLTLALLDFGVWALVTTPIILFWTRAILLVLFTRFRIIPNFNLRGSGDIVGFGLTLLASHGFWLVQTQSDIFIAGRYFDKHQLGLYSTALFVAQLFVAKFIPPLNEVAFPAYSRLQNDLQTMREGFLKAVRLIMLLAFPLYAGLALTADPFVRTIMGPNWVEAIPIVTILALAMPAYTVQILFGPAFNALGKPGLTMRGAIFGAIVMPLSYLIGVRFGITGLALCWVFSMPLLLGYTMLQARTHMGLSMRSLAFALLPGFITACLMGIVVWLFDHLLLQMLSSPLSPLLHLLLLVTVGVIGYVVFLRFGSRAAFDEVLALVIRRKAAVDDQSVAA
jgi:O-antigen/teichoic acid export membrane protein